MERLSFNSSQRYLAIEAAVHIARYGMARAVCEGKRVLDIACGEGYGSYAMAVQWGAQSVTGVDISSEAIDSARHHFTAPNIHFQTGSAYDVSSRFPKDSFDLIVCLETIEHLEDPQLFLRELQSVASPNAAFIISCPNDPRHYGSQETANPFHMRSYSADEFFSLVEEILGPCTRKFIGTPIVGFGNFAIGHEPLQVGREQKAMVQVPLSPTLPALLVPPDDSLELDNGSYYVGVWSADGTYPEFENAALFPCDMNSAAQAKLSEEVCFLRTQAWDLEHSEKAANETIAQLRSQQLESRNVQSTLRNELRHHALRAQALMIENALMRNALKEPRMSSNARREQGQIGFHILNFIRKITRLMPASAKRLGKRIIYGTMR